MLPGESPSRFQATPFPARVPLPRQSERFPFLYRLLRDLGGPIFRAVFDLSVEGGQRLPATGSFILAANHHNYLDGVVLGVAVPRKIVFLVMPSVYHATPLHPPFYRHIGSIPINLERPDPGAIKRTLRVLEEGGILGIFPEGPFSLEGRLVRGQPGVALIALRAGVPVVPVGISGTYEALAGRRWHMPRPHPLTVRFGLPMYFEKVGAEVRIPRALREEGARRIMAEIARLLAKNRSQAAVGT
ncbi:MAG: 1-acyl-sn-glycerol-3-phosphate acyltransferase [Candidatus Rokubacteria bacterium]|nr:1-acyl-sn-glycerol-3-phosphate acyltransferase [Candidatus Rokubacteria bacterium]